MHQDLQKSSLSEPDYAQLIKVANEIPLKANTAGVWKLDQSQMIYFRSENSQMSGIIFQNEKNKGNLEADTWSQIQKIFEILQSKPQDCNVQENQKMCVETANQASSQLLEDESPLSIYDCHGMNYAERDFRDPQHCFTQSDEAQQNLENLSVSQSLRTLEDELEIAVKQEIIIEEEDNEKNRDMHQEQRLTSFNQTSLYKNNYYVNNSGNAAYSQQATPSQLSKGEEKQKAVLSTKLSPEFLGSLHKKRRLGKDPHCTPTDVGRHFLKVHIKKCFNYAMSNIPEVHLLLKDYLFSKQNDLPVSFKENMEDFLTQKTKEFKEWLESLRRKFKDYGKEDFKTAYLINKKELGKEICELEGEESMKKYYSDNAREFELMMFKEILRQISLKFARNAGKNGLRSQLMNSKNKLVEEEHMRYAVLTEWLLEKPSRIDNSEIFGKTWVAKFFRSMRLIS